MPYDQSPSAAIVGIHVLSQCTTCSYVCIIELSCVQSLSTPDFLKEESDQAQDDEHS